MLCRVPPDERPDLLALTVRWNAWGCLVHGMPPGIGCGSLERLLGCRRGRRATGMRRGVGRCHWELAGPLAT
eukprot:6261110-Lingulodinium_polyedra.AAC.1